MQILENGKTIRERIEDYWKPEVRAALRFQCLTGCRRAEVVGKYAPTGKDYVLMDYEDHPVAVFMVKTAKKAGTPRAVALPLEEEYEPWTRLLVKAFERGGSGNVYSMSTRKYDMYCSDAFKGLSYTILGYGENKEHDRPAATHYLRHNRDMELTFVYGFTGMDSAIFLGHTPPGLTSVQRRYLTKLYLQWQSYVPKLFKKR